MQCIVGRDMVKYNENLAIPDQSQNLLGSELDQKVQPTIFVKM